MRFIMPPRRKKFNRAFPPAAPAFGFLRLKFPQNQGVFEEKAGVKGAESAKGKGNRRLRAARRPWRRIR
jgi:hypothetical protein